MSPDGALADSEGEDKVKRQYRETKVLNQKVGTHISWFPYKDIHVVFREGTALGDDIATQPQDISTINKDKNGMIYR